MSQPKRPFSVAIVGGGFTGTMLVCHLIGAAAAGTEIHLFDTRGTFGRGVAYSSPDPHHILNVRAKQMSAYPDQPLHFVQWLRGNEATWRAIDPAYAHLAWDENSFMPRRIFGAYVSACLQTALIVAAAKGIVVHLLPMTVENLSTTGNKFTVQTAEADYTVDACVLATGNARLQYVAGAEKVPTVLPEDLYGMADKVRGCRDIVVMGTGLSMIDALVTLHRQGYAGKVTVISSHGALPLAHEGATPELWTYTPPETPLMASAIVKTVKKAVRQAAENNQSQMPVLAHWRAASNRVWQALPRDAKRRLRRALNFWGPYRHRMPEQAVQLVHLMNASGQLRVVADRIKGLSQIDRINVIGQNGIYQADIVVNALGYRHAADAMGSLTYPLIHDGVIHLADGALHPVTIDSFRISAQHALYACGPLMAGAYLETVAVPELRGMVASLAATLITDLSQDLETMRYLRSTKA